MRDSVYRRTVTAGPARKASGDPPDCRDADTGQVMDFPVREVFLQIFNDLPAINQRLQFGRSTQILEKASDFPGVL